MRGLYPIVDVDSLQELGKHPQSIVEFAERVLVARPALLQLRAKHESARDTLALLRALRPLCTRAGTLLFANDRPDLAELAECDGVHVGQDDLPVALVRKLSPQLRVGISTHDPAQLESALASAPDYIALGPIFGTVSKERPDPVVGVEALGRAHALARAAGIPLVAIGGIDLPRAAALGDRCDLIAVIAALSPMRGSLDGVSERAQALSAAFAAQI